MQYIENGYCHLPPSACAFCPVKIRFPSSAYRHEGGFFDTGKCLLDYALPASLQDIQPYTA